LKKNNKQEFDEITESNQKKFRNLWSRERINALPKISMTPNLSGIPHDEQVEIGGGEHPTHPEYSQVDLKKFGHTKYSNDARLLPFPTNSLTDICSTYTLNCMSRADAEVALREWLRCLKPGGRLEMYLPDLDKLSRTFISNNDKTSRRCVWASNDELNAFKWGTHPKQSIPY
jgi:SAM-dependent methyltransferase